MKNIQKIMWIKNFIQKKLKLKRKNHLTNKKHVSF